MKQDSLFIDVGCEEEDKYVGLVNAPVYKPKGIKPKLFELCDKTKYNELIRKIDKSDIDKLEKDFLKMCATRHLVFDYELIAEYYSHADESIQNLFEESALVIVDFEDAIANGFVSVCEDIKSKYLQEYPIDE